MSATPVGAAGIEYVELRARGRTLRVPSAMIDGRRVVVQGRLPRLAAIQDEEWVEEGRLDDPEKFIDGLRRSGLSADLFTFSQEIGRTGTQLEYPHDVDNAAVIRTSDFDAWWRALPQEARKNVRRSGKRGVELRTVSLDECLVRGIKKIYDETPFRQGRPFWHYGKDLETVLRENSTYLERSRFLGAYLGAELIGFVKWTRVGNVARIMQILALASQQDKRPMNALVAKAAEICSQDGVSYLVYSKFTYGRKGEDSVTEFKRRMGFEALLYPRYYVPLSARGAWLFRIGAHRGWVELLPPQASAWLRRFRAERLDARRREVQPATSPGDGEVQDTAKERKA